MNVLLCIPFGPYPHRIHDLTLQTATALNIDTAYIETPRGTAHDKAELRRKHNEARRLTLDGGYDALLHVDADMVIPADAHDRLFTVDADVVYALYVSRRNVLERLQFRTDGHTGSDWWFAMDCTNYGFAQAHDLGCLCGHIDGDKVYWPDVAEPHLYRTEIL